MIEHRALSVRQLVLPALLAARELGLAARLAPGDQRIAAAVQALRAGR